MGKNKLGNCYIKIHDPKILINNYESCDFKVLDSKLENGHNITIVEIIVKYNCIMDTELEFGEVND